MCLERVEVALSHVFCLQGVYRSVGSAPYGAFLLALWQASAANIGRAASSNSASRAKIAPRSSYPDYYKLVPKAFDPDGDETDLMWFGCVLEDQDGNRLAYWSLKLKELDTGIFFVNLLFGWTVLGWIAAVIWAVVEKSRGQEKPWSVGEPAIRDLSAEERAKRLAAERAREEGMRIRSSRDFLP